MKLCVQRCFRKSLMCFRCAPSTSLGLELCKRSASAHNDICLHNDETVPLYTSGAPGQPGMALHEFVCVGVGVWVGVWVCMCVHVQGQLYCSLAPVSADDHTCCPITFRMHSDVTPEPFAERSSKLCRPSPGYGTYAFEQCVGHFCSIKPLPHVSV